MYTERLTRLLVRISARWVAKWGVLSFFRNVWSLLGPPRQLELRLPGILEPIILRKTIADLGAFEQIWLREQYKLASTHGVDAIFDCGANIGLATRFFAQQFPNTPIIAIEPESSNFKLLERNVGANRNVIMVQCALWSETGHITVSDVDDGAWSFRTAPIKEGGHLDNVVPAVTVVDLFQRYIKSGDRVLLKIDIEGAEEGVFRANATEWLKNVSILIVETHDRFDMPTAKSVFDALREFDYRCNISLDNFVITILRRESK